MLSGLKCKDSSSRISLKITPPGPKSIAEDLIAKHPIFTAMDIRVFQDLLAPLCRGAQK